MVAHCAASDGIPAVIEVAAPQHHDDLLAREAMQPILETPTVPPAVAKLVGVWEDPETGGLTRSTVELRGSRPVVVSCFEHSGSEEKFEVRASRYVNDELEWSYFVPSSGYLVTIIIERVDGDTAHIRWTNDHQGEGTGVLNRVVEGSDEDEDR